MEMCRWLFKGFAEKNGRHGSTSIFFWVQKLKKLKAEIIQILQSHSPRNGDVHVIFKVLRNFKMAAMDELHKFLWSQKLKNRQ